MLIPAFQLSLNNNILSGLACIGKCKHPDAAAQRDRSALFETDLAVAVGGRVFGYSHGTHVMQKRYVGVTELWGCPGRTFEVWDVPQCSHWSRVVSQTTAAARTSPAPPMLANSSCTTHTNGMMMAQARGSTF